MSYQWSQPCVKIIPMVNGLSSGGTNLTVTFLFTRNTLGLLLVAATEQGVCHVMFVASEAEGFAELKARWPQANFQFHNNYSLRDNVQLHNNNVLPHNLQTHSDRHLRQCLALLKPYLTQEHAENTRGVAPCINLHLAGSHFEHSVWQQLLKIPMGQVCAYGQIAAAIGQPKAARAVGSAIGKNAVALMIPCHRVVRADGQLGGYRWGVTRKQALLAHEAKWLAGIS